MGRGALPAQIPLVVIFLADVLSANYLKNTVIYWALQPSDINARLQLLNKMASSDIKRYAVLTTSLHKQSI